MTAPRVSCLCVTEGRAAFIPWLLWGFDRQTWPDRELVIVDSSARPWVSTRADVRVIVEPPGTGIARKRNLALAAAQGELVTWFDDDDWQHPEKLAWLVAALGDNGATYAGSSAAWFLDLHAARCAPFTAPAGWPIFNSAVFRRAAVQAIAFPDSVVRGSDSRWLRQVIAGGPGVAIPRDDLFCWLTHDANISNPAGQRPCAEPLRVLRDHLGPAAWGDTDAALDAVRARLAAAPPTVSARRPVGALAGSDAAAPRSPVDPVPPEVAPSYHLETHPIRRLRRAPHVNKEHTRVFYRTFELDLERGQGLATGQGSDPVVLLRLSRDGGQTWGEEIRMAAGRLGAYTQRVIARRLGHARDTVFEVTVSDPIAWSLVDAWLDLEPGTS